MKSLIQRRAAAFLGDEQGDEGVNKVLIIALIAVPLILLLIAFKDTIIEWFQTETDKLNP